MTEGFLRQACAEALDRVADDRRRRPDAAVMERAQATPAPASMAQALAADGVAVIAEIKRASPSRGRMSDIPDPAALAVLCASGGAAAISVLTEPAHFEGSLDDLIAVAQAVDVPVLRKDFTVDAYQVWQAREAGAAAVLLIVAALDDGRLTRLMGAAEQAGLDALIETHSEGDVARAVQAHQRAAVAGPLILGVNTRDLATLTVDRDHFARIRQNIEVPEDVLLVAESGVRDVEDVMAYAAAGADAVLVGEYVATAVDPKSAIAGLLVKSSTD